MACRRGQHEKHDLLKIPFPKFTYLHISMQLNQDLAANSKRGRGMAVGLRSLVCCIVSLSMLKFLSPETDKQS